MYVQTSEGSNGTMREASIDALGPCLMLSSFFGMLGEMLWNRRRQNGVESGNGWARRVSPETRHRDSPAKGAGASGSRGTGREHPPVFALLMKGPFPPGARAWLWGGDLRRTAVGGEWSVPTAERADEIVIDDEVIHQQQASNGDAQESNLLGAHCPGPTRASITLPGPATPFPPFGLRASLILTHRPA